MREIQHTLDLLSLLPISTAFALFCFHMVNCWNRTGHSHQIPGAGEVAESETGIPAAVEIEVEQALDRLVDLGLIAEIPDEVLEECGQPVAESLNGEPRWAAMAMEPATAQITVSVDEEDAIATLEKSTPFHAFSRPQQPVNPIKMNVPQLRQECQRLGIKWRNHHGKGKHLSREQMLQAIGMAIA